MGSDPGSQEHVTPFEPGLGHPYRDDPLLASWLRRTLTAESLRELAPELDELGAVAAGPLHRRQLADRANEPRLVTRDASGNRIDRLEVTPLWREAERLALRHGLVATAYEPAHGRHARTAQFAKVYLFHPSSDAYSSQLAMTDGAACLLLESGDRDLAERVLPRLTARDPALAWTSGLWMTEATGGSDVGSAETRAVPDGDEWRLHGRKLFASAIGAPMALTLARPAGNAPGGRGLALFYVEVRDADGRLNGLRFGRLADKLGTRKVATAELTLDGARARLVGPPRDGTAAIEPMLGVTRLWNSVCAVSDMRRGLALARAFASRREAFGRPLARQPLHADTLAALEAETWGAFLMTFLLVELTGRFERREIDDGQRALLRLVTPLGKLATARQAVAVLSEVVESFGGAGYLEGTGLPQQLRDAHVLPIWGGTTNVLALDALLRADLNAGLAALIGRASSCVRSLADPRLAAAGRQAMAALERAVLWLESSHDRELLEAGARRLALTLARSLQLALLCEHAQWMLDHGGDRRGYAAALRYSRRPVDLLQEMDTGLDHLLLE